jgi:hypothetical protein
MQKKADHRGLLFEMLGGAVKYRFETGFWKVNVVSTRGNDFPGYIISSKRIKEESSII